MPEANVFQIEEGVFALTLVNTADIGYLSTWQAPEGATAATAVEADYVAGSSTWKCQVTSAALEASQSTNSVDVPATFCAPSRSIPQPAQTSYTLNAEFLQDPHVAAGLSRFLFENDTSEAYFLLGLAGDDPPRAVGRVRLVAGSFGGAARENLVATIALPVTMKPSIEFGDATTSAVV